jgi:hypothetical protein
MAKQYAKLEDPSLCGDVEVSQFRDNNAMCVLHGNVHYILHSSTQAPPNFQLNFPLFMLFVRAVSHSNFMDSI